METDCAVPPPDPLPSIKFAVGEGVSDRCLENQFEGGGGRGGGRGAGGGTVEKGRGMDRVSVAEEEEGGEDLEACDERSEKVQIESQYIKPPLTKRVAFLTRRLTRA